MVRYGGSRRAAVLCRWCWLPAPSWPAGLRPCRRAAPVRPPAPAGLKAAGASYSVRLSWQPPEDGLLLSYHVYRIRGGQRETGADHARADARDVVRRSAGRRRRAAPLCGTVGEPAGRRKPVQQFGPGHGHGRPRAGAGRHVRQASPRPSGRWRKPAGKLQPPARAADGMSRPDPGRLRAVRPSRPVRPPAAALAGVLGTA